MVQRYEDRLIRVVNYIHDNLDGDLSLDALADVAAMSRFHWHRIWTAMTGETLAQTTRRVRLYRAAVMLVREDVPVAEIAARCGYPDRASFARAFRDTMGVTPGHYRTEGRAIPPLWLNRKETGVTHDVKVTTEAPRRVAGIAHAGDYQQISRAFEALGATLGARGGWPQARGMVGVFYHDPRNVPEPDLRAHAGAVMPEEFAITDPLEEVRLQGGDHAVLRFRGPYAGLQSAYDYFLGPWLAQSGRDPAESPCFEVYLNSPMEVAPEALLTDIYLPLRPQAATTG